MSYLVCTFFGHSDAPWDIQSSLEAVLSNLIENHNVNTFYVGNHGNFDIIVLNVLQKLKVIYPFINYSVVLAYLPNKKSSENCYQNTDTVYPAGLETTPPKFAIDKRNRWMIEQCDYVITYVKHSFGGAAKFKLISEKKGKIVCNIADDK